MKDTQQIETGNKSMSFALDLKREPDADGTFEGYASVFENVDSGMDVITRGAFTKSLDGRKPKMLWQHNPNDVIGVWDEVAENDRGLYVKGRISSGVEKGREALELLRMGAIDAMSIGYRTVQAVKEGNGSVRRLTELDLFEVSLVTFPMNELAMVTDVKSITTEREFERALRDAGFTRKEATAITLHGFKGLADQRDAVEVEAATGFDNDTLNLLRQLQEKFTNVRGNENTR
jgi:HK97 family phage prohead protease